MGSAAPRAVGGPPRGGDVAWDDRLPTRPAIGDDRRFGILRRRLHDRELDLRDRFAGSVLLLYGKPITKICAFRTAVISVDADGGTTLQLGRGENPLPEPLGSIALAVRYRQLKRTGAAGWLLPGRHAGTHITADTLRGRLKRYGISSDFQTANRHLVGGSRVWGRGGQANWKRSCRPFHHGISIGGRSALRMIGL
jgi:hypothetical protein